jgi:ABC-type multidrug transport system fused ATPase/permease subunit
MYMILIDLVKRYLGEHKAKIILYFLVNIFYYPLEIYIFSILFSRLFVQLRGTKDIKMSLKDPTLRLICLICGLYALTNIAKVGKYELENRILPGLINYTRSNMFDSILQKMKKNYKDIKIGDIITRFIRIPSALTHIIRQIMTSILPGILTLIIICGLSFYLNTGFGIIMTVAMVVSILIMRSRFYTCKHLFYRRVKIFNKNNQDIQDRFLNLFNIFLSNQVDIESKDNLARETYFKDTYFESMKCVERGKMMNNTFLVFIFVVAFYYLIFMTNLRKENVAVLIALIIIVGHFLKIIDHLQTQIPFGVQNVNVIDESTEFFDEIFSGNKENGEEFEINGKIVFNNVSFKYNTKSKYSIENINIDIDVGDKVYIMGKAGSGKSTIVKLLTGFYRANEGEILLDDNNVDNFDIEYLRENIGFMTQHLTLFDKTIMENILYGNNQNLNEEYVENFVKENNINIFDNIAEELNKNVGPSGNNISGGQKQMTLILRLILSDKKILILDEPTTALDDKTFQTFLHLMKGIENRTIIIISHDNRFKHNDFSKVFKMENGKIIN